MKVLIELADKSQCTGCAACVSVCPHHCIYMKKGMDGFLYPEIYTSHCISCGACERVCPILNDFSKDNSILGVYSAYSKNDLLRISSSSGGIFSELATEILNLGGVVYGAIYNTNGSVEHMGIENIDMLEKLRGAKYSQSWLGDTFKIIKEQLETGRNILFSGMPCQVAGLKAFLHQDYDNLFCIDFVCHGVPSADAWEKYIKYRAQIDNNGIFPRYVNMRNKESGWSKYSYSIEMVYSNEKRYISKNCDDPFMNFFVGDYILRKSCGNCHFKGFNRISDITLGDFWGIWDIDSEMDDNKGTSLVLTHSSKGEELFRSILDNLKCKKATLEQAAKTNPSLVSSSIHKANRDELLKDLMKNDFKSTLNLLQSTDNRHKSLLSNMRKILSIIKGDRKDAS